MKLKYITFLIAGAALGTGCKKGLLDLYPEGNIASGNFFRNTSDFQMAVVGAYVPLRNIADQAYYMDEMRADNTHYEYNSKDRGGAGFEQLGDFTDNSQNGVTGARYNQAFSGIHRCNTILDRLEKITFDMASADLEQIEGEAKALRAHYYFDLVRHFGKVPMPLHELLTPDPKQVFLPRTSIDSVYDQIIADFKDAYELLKAPETVPASGRMNKGVVASELGLVYMTRKQWDKAVPLLQSVTGMKYDLLTNYRDNFDPAKKGANKEAIFEVQYKSGTDGQQSIFPYRFMPVSDSSKAMLDIEYSNQNGGWNTPTADLMRQYEADDKRMNASIGYFEGYVGSNGVFKVEKLVTEDVRTYVTPPGKASRVFAKKYYFFPYKIPAYNTDQNWPVFRLGGVLLLLAEALNENNQSGDALAPLNRVRQRAGLLPVNITDQAQLRDIIAKEQRLELAFENYRWLDLVRTGKAAQVMTAHGVEMKSLYGYLSASSYNVTEKKYIYPIPFREMQLNPTWTQNDY